MKIQITNTIFTSGGYETPRKYPMLYLGEKKEKVFRNEVILLFNYTLFYLFNISSYTMLFIGLLDGINSNRFKYSLVGIIEYRLYKCISKKL